MMEKQGVIIVAQNASDLGGTPFLPLVGNSETHTLYFVVASVLMVLAEIVVLAAAAATTWSCPIQAFQAHGGFGRRAVTRDTTAVEKTSYSTRRRREIPFSTPINMSPPRQTPVVAASGRAAASLSCAAETTYVNEQRTVHIATRQAWLENEDEDEITISDLIAQQAAVSADRARELVRFGAVYIGEVVESGWKITAKKQRHGESGRGSGDTGRGPVSTAAAAKLASKGAQQTPFRGTSFEHMKLRRLGAWEAESYPPTGAYLRVHCDPRTFPVARSTDWAECIIAATDDYVVVDKPAGVPSVPTIDNAVENALHQTGLAVSKISPPSASSSSARKGLSAASASLHAVSRLDVCTSGLIVFARSKPAAATLNQIFRDRQVSKRYLALLTPGPAITLGQKAHCCRSKALDGSRRPRIYADYDEELLGGEKWGGAWQEALSTVLLCAPATGSSAAAAVADDRAETEATARAAEASSECSAERLEADLEAALSSMSLGSETGRGESGVVSAASTAGASAAAASDSQGEGTPVSPVGADVSGSQPAEADSYPAHLCAMQLETGRTHQLRLQLAAMGAAVVGDTRYRGIVGRVHRGLAKDDRTDIFGKEPETIALQAARIEFAWGNEWVAYSAKRPSWASEN